MTTSGKQDGWIYTNVKEGVLQEGCRLFSTINIKQKKKRRVGYVDDGIQPPALFYTFDVDKQEARTRLAQQSRRDPFFYFFLFLTHRLTSAVLLSPYFLCLLFTANSTTTQQHFTKNH